MANACRAPGSHSCLAGAPWAFQESWAGTSSPAQPRSQPPQNSLGNFVFFINTSVKQKDADSLCIFFLTLCACVFIVFRKDEPVVFFSKVMFIEI